jgi:MoaA/NifB/PqqE/SkfB family radical SAM enzyme
MIAEHDAVAPSTLTSASDQLVESHEEAAHEKRNWVRLSYDCNNHCLFCLDLLAHNGTMRSNMDIKVQIVEGRKKGAERLILSGGEPTMHPNFLDFVKLGKRAGYPKVQTVTNGRMFAYPQFLEKAAANGLDEITFSLHGHTAALHDGLVATPGAFVEETAGLHAAVASGRFIVNIDIVITKRNVKHLPEMLETFIGWGVKEFDLLHIIPFGAAWGRAKDHLFYDLEGNEEPIRRALEYSKRPDVHIWLNRFPPPHTEGFEYLIQDPYKMNDEVRGRREEYDRYLTVGEKLSCREPERCKVCYLQQLCDTLDDAIAERKEAEVDVLRLAEPAPRVDGLPRARVVHVVTNTLAAAERLADHAKAGALWLDLPAYDGLFERLAPDGTLFGKRLERCYVSTGTELARLLEQEGAFDVAVWLNNSTATALAGSNGSSKRLVVCQPKYDRVTDQRKNDVELRTVLRELPPDVRTEDVPPCLGLREPMTHGTRLDTEMLGPDGRLDMPRYTKRYVTDRFMTKSRRCATCAYTNECKGVHINFVRAHGYGTLEPLGKKF